MTTTRSTDVVPQVPGQLELRLEVPELGDELRAELAAQVLPGWDSHRGIRSCRPTFQLWLRGGRSGPCAGRAGMAFMLAVDRWLGSLGRPPCRSFWTADQALRTIAV